MGFPLPLLGSPLGWRGNKMEPGREGEREIILQLHLIRETGPVQSWQCRQGSTGRGGKRGRKRRSRGGGIKL